MITMQYYISLPSDYDMNVIKKRVQDNGSKTDGFPDLRMKAYLIAEKTKYQNRINQYAPFYLWENTDGMNQFLLGGPFNNIINSYERPAVHNWLVLYAKVTKKAAPQFAITQTERLPAGSDFNILLQQEEENFSNQTDHPATTAYLSAYNPLTWELCHFHMSTDLDLIAAKANDSLLYDVHHIS